MAKKPLKIAIVGACGLLGSELLRTWKEGGDTLVPLDLPDFDIASRMFALDALEPLKPDVILNAAGIGMIDWLEKRPNTARTIHTHGTANLREAAKRTGALLVQISCGEVFGQEGDKPHCEDEKPDPRSVYAKTKLDSERACSEWEKHLIIRTGTLFGAAGPKSCGNQVETILNAVRKIRSFKVLNDIRLSPSWTHDLALGIRSLIGHGMSGSARGIWHLANSGTGTHFDLASELRALTGLRFELEPIKSEEYEFAAPRSQCPALDAAKYAELPNVYQMRPWRKALAAYIESRSSGV